MTRPDSIHPSLASSATSLSEPERAQRLIVLVPELEWDYIPAMHRIWELANALSARVLLISLCNDPRRELSLRRALVTFCAMVQDGRISTEAKVEIGTNWVDAVKRNYQTGDMIVCFAEQRVGLLHRPLSQILHSNLNAPVYILSGLYPQNLSRSNWLSQLLAWMGSIVIIAGSSLLQIRIISLPQDWAQTTLLIISVMVEIWLIGGWNNLFS